jgi:cell division protease FtsH
VEACDSNEGLEQRRRVFFTGSSNFAAVHRQEIVGIDPILERVDDLVDALRASETLERYGARLESGVLFEGPPGTGKTLVARYVATVSDALFINAREFPTEGGELSARDVAALFRLARETYRHTKRPIVIFWDEFDDHARCAPNGPLYERSILAQLKADLDGVTGKNTGIVVVACTNHAHAIDHALLRAGRISTRLRFCAPDLGGKARLIDHYLASRPTAGPIDSLALAELLESDASAATIAESVDSAWQRAVLCSTACGTEPALTQTALDEALINRRLGERSSSTAVSPTARHRAAIHEAGHALVALAAGMPVVLITLRADGRGAGRMLPGALEQYSIEQHKACLRVDLAGMCAEERLGLGAGAGNGSDTDQATRRARWLVAANDVGERCGAFNPFAGDPRFSAASGEMLARLDLDAADLLEEARMHADAVLRRIGTDAICRVAEALLERETIRGPEIAELAGLSFDPPLEECA